MARLHDFRIALAMLLPTLAAAQSTTTSHPPHHLKPAIPAETQASAVTPSASAPPTAKLAPPPVNAARIPYRPFTPNEPMLDWRGANDTVRQIGGWRTYAKEAASANSRDSTRAAGATP